jgi:hypothetical protein
MTLETSAKMANGQLILEEVVGNVRVIRSIVSKARAYCTLRLRPQNPELSGQFEHIHPLT